MLLGVYLNNLLIYHVILLPVVIDASVDRCHKETVLLSHRNHASVDADVELWVEVTRQSTRRIAETLLASGKADGVR